jgi:hypothetical protein
VFLTPPNPAGASLGLSGNPERSANGNLFPKRGKVFPGAACGDSGVAFLRGTVSIETLWIVNWDNLIVNVEHWGLGYN